MKIKTKHLLYLICKYTLFCFIIEDKDTNVSWEAKFYCAIDEKSIYISLILHDFIYYMFWRLYFE